VPFAIIVRNGWLMAIVFSDAFWGPRYMVGDLELGRDKGVKKLIGLYTAAVCSGQRRKKMPSHCEGIKFYLINARAEKRLETIRQ